jgi:hypothetical protein
MLIFYDFEFFKFSFLQIDLTKSNSWTDSIENELNRIENTQCRNELIQLIITNKKN